MVTKRVVVDGLDVMAKDLRDVVKKSLPRGKFENVF